MPSDEKAEATDPMLKLGKIKLPPRMTAPAPGEGAKTRGQEVAEKMEMTVGGIKTYSVHEIAVVIDAELAALRSQLAAVTAALGMAKSGLHHSSSCAAHRFSAGTCNCGVAEALSAIAALHRIDAEKAKP